MRIDCWLPVTPVRVTFDVDLVARVSALAAYHGIEKEFVRLGFSRDTTGDAPICRWRYRGLEVDLMPMDSKVLGFANRWYPLAVETAQDVKLPSFAELLMAPNFLDVLPGMIFPDEPLADRTQVVSERVRLLAQQDKDWA